MLDLLAFKATDVPVKNELPQDIHDLSNLNASSSSSYSTEEGKLLVTSKNNTRAVFQFSESVPEENQGDLFYGALTYELPPVELTAFRIRVVRTIHRLTSADWLTPNTKHRFSEIDDIGSLVVNYGYAEYTEDQESATYKISNRLLINLTKTFGEGNEPSKNTMDRLMDKFEERGFDGTVSLFNAKDFMVFVIKELEEQRNAITSLGGNL